MKKSFLFSALLLILFNNAALQAFQADSIQYFSKQFDQALKEDRTSDASDIISYLYKQASSSLDPAVYEMFYSKTEDPAVKEHPGLSGQIYHFLGNLEFYRARMDAAKQGFSRALIQYRLAGQTKDAAGMAMNLGIIMERYGKYDSAILSYETAIPIFLELGDTAAVAVCTENIALAHHYKGNQKKAMEFMNKTDSILRLSTPEDNVRWTNFYYNKSSILESQSRHDEAIESAYKGLRLSEKLNVEKQINIGYIILIHAYQSFGDTENWLELAREAEKFARKTENELRLTELNESFAYHFLDQNKLDSAIYYADQVEKYYSADNISEGISKSMLLKGNIAYQQKQYDKAITEFEKALNDLSTSGSKELARAYHNLGMSYFMKGDLQQAEAYLLLAVESRKDMDDLKGMSITFNRLAEVKEKQGDFQMAVNYFRQHKSMDDSVFTENKSRQIAMLQTQYETEKKDQEIASLQQSATIQSLLAEKRQNQIYLALGGLGLLFLLAFIFYYRSRLKHRANRILQVKNQEIEKQYAEKELLLKEIHHRVKNNLQIISSLLSMQSRGETDLKVKDAMKESQSRVKTMALIHEKLYQYDNLSRIRMQEYMDQLSSFLSETYRSDKQIRIVTDTEDINLDIDYAVPLGLITNELLSNALKYAFQETDQGVITIRLKKEAQDRYILVVSDTGTGLGDDLDISKTSSLGLKLVRTLTRQIQGNLKISNTPGATFSIEFTTEQLAA